MTCSEENFAYQDLFSILLGPITFIANLFWGPVLVTINHSFRALYLTLQEYVCVWWGYLHKCLIFNLPGMFQVGIV